MLHVWMYRLHTDDDDDDEDIDDGDDGDDDDDDDDDDEFDDDDDEFDDDDDQGCSYGGRRRAGPPSTHDFRPAQPQKKWFPPGTKNIYIFFFFFFFLVPGTMFHNRGSIIAQYTYVIYIENDLVRLWIPAGALPLDPRSLVLLFIGFTHSPCHYYSQLFSTTQIGLAATLMMMVMMY